MRCQFGVARTVGGLGEVTTVGRGPQGDDPVRNPGVLAGDHGGAAIDGDDRDRAVVMGNPAHGALATRSLDARDQGRGGQIIHGREELREVDALRLARARFGSGPALNAAISAALRGLWGLNARDARHRS